VTILFFALKSSYLEDNYYVKYLRGDAKTRRWREWRSQPIQESFSYLYLVGRMSLMSICRVIEEHKSGMSRW
jgi:hypothetical protein